MKAAALFDSRRASAVNLCLCTSLSEGTVRSVCAMRISKASLHLILAQLTGVIVYLNGCITGAIMSLARQPTTTDTQEALLITKELQAAAAIDAHLLLHLVHCSLHLSHFLNQHLVLAGVGRCCGPLHALCPAVVREVSLKLRGTAGTRSVVCTWRHSNSLASYIQLRGLQ